MKVLVLGASLESNRYSNMAIKDLLNYNHDVLAVGNRVGEVLTVTVQRDLPKDTDINTVTIYLGEKNQAEYQDYLLNLAPKRVIFNPGAENSDLYTALQKKGVNVMEACTLVMLRTNQF